MNQTIPLAEQQTGVNATETITASPPKSVTLRDSVRAALREYFTRLEGQQPANLYELVLAEIESPLLEMVLQYTGQNQSTAAKMLDISRGTLRKKMQRYGYLNPKKKAQ
jgi:DNA-binding protein Fis